MSVKKNLKRFTQLLDSSMHVNQSVSPPQTASALVAAAPGHASVSDVQLPSLATSGVLIRTSVSGVSTGTDRWVLEGRFTWDDVRFPLVAGYQRVGIVEAIGPEVTEFTPGQVVAATISTFVAPVHGQWGAHCSTGISPQEEVFDATGVHQHAASLFVSAQVGVNAASRLTVEPGSRVAVIGGGIIGSAAALAAKARGFEVLAVDRHHSRLGQLESLGLSTAHASQDPSALRDWRPTGVIDTTQNDEAFASYIDVLPHAGEVISSGHSPDGQKWWADMTRMQQRELTAHFVSGWTPARLTHTLELMRRGLLPIESLVGEVARTRSQIDDLARAVIEGTLKPIAAVIDWSDSGKWS